MLENSESSERSVPKDIQFTMIQNKTATIPFGIWDSGEVLALYMFNNDDWQ